MMEKHSLFSGQDAGGYPLIHLVEPGTRYGLNKTAGLDKTKSSEHLPEVQELIESIKPQPNRLYIVNSALGAGEFVGFNLRDDWFTEEGLVHEPPGWKDIPVWDIDKRRQAANWTDEVPGWGPLCWGYPSFYNANRFAHHANQDAGKTRGRILGAFYDHRMHRVILVSEVLKELCEKWGSMDVYNKIAKGDPVDTSMGSRVPGDLCAYCMNWARTPAEYCEHLNGSNPKFGRGKILPNGQKMGMYNLHPRFFDDSFVFVGAEKSAKVMSNVTDKVKGTNEYTDKLYPYTPKKAKTAAFGESEREEEDRRRDRVVESLKKPLGESTFEAKLSKLVSGQNLSGREKRAVETIQRQSQGKDTAFNPRQQAASDYLLAQQFENDQGVPLAQFDYLRERLGHQLDFASRTKVGSTKRASLIKWAEMLKRLPAPTAAELSFVRNHEGKLETLPDSCLDALSKNPAENIRGAANLGVVLKPEEFQHVMLGEKNKAYKGKVFKPKALDADDGPDFDMRPTDAATNKVVKDALKDSAESRSFAPRMVRSQLDRRKKAHNVKLAEYSDPTLDEVADLYNSYRGGILVTSPSWANVYPNTKMADSENESELLDASQSLSRALTALAFWPALGLDSIR